MQCSGQPRKLRRRNWCSVNNCDPVTNCDFTISDALCNDANDCTLDTCSLSSDCTHIGQNGLCDDGWRTLDACDINGGCEHVADVTVCTDSINRTIDTRPASGLPEPERQLPVRRWSGLYSEHVCTDQDVPSRPRMHCAQMGLRVRWEPVTQLLDAPSQRTTPSATTDSPVRWMHATWTMIVFIPSRMDSATMESRVRRTPARRSVDV